MNTPCIEHTQRGSVDGYGRVSRNGKSLNMHRAVYCDNAGVSIESIRGLVIRHTCDNTRCINPEHLVPGTQAQNVQDAVERNRQPRAPGTANGSAVLSEDQVLAIREEYRPKVVTLKSLSIKYGVSIHNIHAIIKRKLWKHI